MMERKGPGSEVVTLDGRPGKIFSISGSGEDSIATVEIIKKSYAGATLKTREDIPLKDLKPVVTK